MGRINRFFGLVVDYPRWALALVIAITVASLVGYYDPKLVTVRRPLPIRGPLPIQRESPRREMLERPEVLPNVRSVQLSGWDAVLIVQSADIFQPQSAAGLRAAVNRLKELKHVDEVFWMEDLPPLNIFGLREPVLPADGSSVYRFQNAKEKAMANPLVGGFMLASDGKSTMIMVRFDWLFVQNDADCSARLIEVAREAASASGDNDLVFHVTGEVPIRIALMERNQSNERTYQIISSLFTLLMAAILFRGLSAVLVVAAAPGLGVFWTLGLLRFFDLQDNPFNHVVLPIMISLVGFTDGVHMMVQIRTKRFDGMAPRDATRKTLHEVGLACFLTSLTTAIGFASLGLAHHQEVREFGWCCVIGVAVTFVSAITVIPLLCLTRLGDRVQRGHGKGLIDRNFGHALRLIDVVLRYRRSIAIGGVLLLFVLMGICLTLEPDQRNTSSLPTRGEEMQSLRLMDRTFGGLETGEISITWAKTIEDNAPEVLQVVQAIDQMLGEEPLIGRPISIGQLLAALPGEGPFEERMSLMELLPPPIKRPFYVPERNYSSIQFRIQDIGIAKYGPVFQRLEDQLVTLQGSHPGFTLRLTGNAVWRWEHIYRVVLDLVTSLGTASVVILLVLGVAYRSVRIGLIAIAPNIFPLVVTGTFMAISGYPLEMVSVCSFTICLGIAVDDTIHFLTRYQEEQLVVGNNDEAIRRAFMAAGTGMMMTTIVLTAGFCMALTSDTYDHRVFAGMGALTVVAALVGDLVILPALLAYFPPWGTTDLPPSPESSFGARIE